jgi:hypothetical protein
VSKNVQPKVVLSPYNDSFAFVVECDGEHGCAVTATGGGQFHFDDGKSLKHLSSLKLRRALENVKGNLY